MKTLFQTLFFFLLVTQICFAQWYQQNSGTTANLRSVHFEDANKGWAVGDSGTILHTTNGGTAWAIQASGTILPLSDIFFTDGYNGWAVGSNVYSWEGSVIIHTTDGGATWNTQLILPDIYLTDIFFIDENIGWAVGLSLIIIKTTNGGSTWIEQSNPATMALEDVYFVDANLGFIAAQYDWMYGTIGGICKTTNGGDNWSIRVDSSCHWLGISFSDSLNGIVVGWGCYPQGTGCGIIFRTTDGGINWASVLVMAGVEFRSVVFTDANNWWVVGSGIILYTNDGGLIWTTQLNDFPSPFICVDFTDPLTGWVVGANGTILHTTNGGVPVELTSFTATANGKEVILNWSTATELNNQLFEIQRSFEGSEFATVGFVNGKGTTTERQDYSYSDEVFTNGKYYYRLNQVDYDGSYEYSDVVEVDFRTFNSYLLEQNFPNPFNPTTTIGFGLQNKSNVKITILNAIGEEVAVILNEEKEPGYHQIEFNATNLPSGVYFYRLQAGDFISTKKMILIK